MESSSKSSGISPGILKLSPLIVNQELHSLIGTVKKIQLNPTYEEVLEGLKIYIWNKKLIDPVNPIKVCCKDDKLGSVFGTQEFTLYDVKNILSKLIYPADNSNKNSAEASSLHSVSENLSKRKNDEIDEPDVKRVCSESLPLQCMSPMILHIPSSPTSENTSDSIDSIQGYETAFVKDTSDDLISIGDSTDFLTGEERILAIEETFDLEYEVESDSSESCMTSDSTDSDIDSITEVALDTAILTLLTRKEDSDIEFFADNSSEDDCDYDREMSKLDHWTCNTCKSLNPPPMRYCLKCWDQRLGWLPERQIERRLHPKRKRKHKDIRYESPVKDSSNKAKVSLPDRDSQGSCALDVLSSSSEIKEDVPSSSCNVSPLDNCDTDAKLCIICCSKPANASIIHGKFAHQVSCYRCARKLEKRKKRCPVCRRTIDKVVYQISC